MKKRILSLLLALTLSFSLALPVMAKDNVTVSPQKLTVDGKSVDCEKYNINGSNYFKLRDLAMLMRGTSAAFDIAFDNGSRSVYVTTDAEYTPVGGELAAGNDNSATCVRSTWKMFINGQPFDASAYNIGGSNFFKLRDIGEAVDFAVDYNPDSNTAVVYSDKAHTATIDSLTPYAESAKLKLAAPCAYTGLPVRYEGVTPGVDCLETTSSLSAPTITRTAPDANGYVTYTIKRTADCTFTSNTEYNGNGQLRIHEGMDLYDYYTGVMLPRRDFNKFNVETHKDNDDFSNELTNFISFRGTRYRISYRYQINETASDPTYSTINGKTWATYVVHGDISITITVPQFYDGLMLGFNPTLPPAEEDAAIDNTNLTYLKDSNQLNGMEFVRLSDHVK